MPSTGRKQQEESGSNVGSAIFASGEVFDMKDKVTAIHEHFDRDQDNHLNFQELRSLQLVTSGADMSSEQYRHVCTMLDCHPDKGLSLDALRLTYAAEGTNIESDFTKVFPDGKAVLRRNKQSQSKTKKEEEDGDVIEVGEGGVDIS